MNSQKTENTLDLICAKKREHVAACKVAVTESTLRQRIKEQSSPRGFKNAILEKINSGKPALIAEIKKASPSRGLIRSDFTPAELAKSYLNGGAACLSVLTDSPYFQGADEYLIAARASVPIPVLRKDFIIDSYQITESRALGADCVLLIMAALSDAQAQELEQEASELGMDVLVEVHDLGEMERALAINSGNDKKLLGINNRNLKTLEVTLNTSLELARHIPSNTIGVCESGINTYSDIKMMQKAGLNTFLVGESLMKQSDVELATKKLLGLGLQ